MFVTMITLLSTALFIVKECSAQCKGIGKNECCSGYKWNETFGICSKCKPGYFGVGCRSHCTPPSYGEGCQLSCTHCSIEECDISWGCPRITTTRVLQKTNEFSTDKTSALDYLSLKTTDHISQYKHNSTFEVLPAKEIQSCTCFTKEVILIICSCGVGLVILTLAIVFACKFTWKKYMSARKNVDYSASEVYQEPTRYEEVLENERLSANPASYSPLQQTVVNEQNNSFNRSIKSEYSLEDRKDKYYYNVQLQRLASADIAPIPVSHFKSAATDTGGYEYPPFPDSTVNNEITPMMPLGKPYVKNDSENDKGGVYLTVIHNSD